MHENSRNNWFDNLMLTMIRLLFERSITIKKSITWKSPPIPRTMPSQKRQRRNLQRRKRTDRQDEQQYFSPNDTINNKDSDHEKETKPLAQASEHPPMKSFSNKYRLGIPNGSQMTTSATTILLVLVISLLIRNIRYLHQVTTPRIYGNSTKSSATAIAMSTVSVSGTYQLLVRYYLGLEFLLVVMALYVNQSNDSSCLRRRAHTWLYYYYYFTDS